MSKIVAGIDLGSEKLHVGILGHPVKIFECFTDSLHQLRDYLKSRGVTSVAMEATGVYWFPVFNVLDEAGLEVFVVNGAHVKNVPGRKTDISDCQWLAQLHSQGLLRSGFIPEPSIRKLRQYSRLRQDHVRSGAEHILHMQKALDLMNIKIHDVLSQTVGMSCLRMIRAIVDGVRNPELLLSLCDGDVLRRKKDRLLRALEGTWDKEHIFALKQALAGWDFYQSLMAQCDTEIHKVLQELAVAKPGPAEDIKLTKKKKHAHNAPLIQDLDRTLYQITGVDLNALPCLSSYSQLMVVSELGTDLTPWPTHKHFVAWLGLAPGSRQSGKRRRAQRRFRGTAGRIFCVAARSLGRSKYLALSGFYKRLRATRGPQVANIACARKIAILFYNAMTRGLKYVEQGLEAYEKKYREQCIKRVKRNARALGLTIVEPQLA